MAKANDAWMYASGPVDVFVRAQTVGPNPQNPTGAGSGEAIAYLGTCVKPPEFGRAKQWGPIWSTIGGTMVPFDMSYQGQLINLGMDLGRHSDTVLRDVEDCPNFGRVVKNGDAGPDGLELVGDVGAMAMGQGLGLEVWFLNRFWKYSTRNLFAYPDLRPGYYFRCCIPVWVGRDKDGEPQSTVRLDLLSLRVYDPTTMSFLQYDSQAARFTGAALPDPG